MPSSSTDAATAAVAHQSLDRGFLFSADGIGREIDAATAIAWLQRDDPPAGEFVWLHFHDIPSALEGWSTKLAEVPSAFGDAIQRGYKSTRVMRSHQHLIAVLNDIDYDVARGRSLEVATLWVSVDDRCLLSMRSAQLRSVERVRRDVQTGHPFANPMALLIRLLREQAEVLLEIAHDTVIASNATEKALFEGKLPRNSRLAVFRRDLMRLRRLLAPEPAALFRLASQAPDWLRDEDAQALRQCAEHFSLILRDTSALEQRIRLLQEEITEKVGEHTNRSVLILTSVTVIALPINVISGLLGMNVGGIPFKDSDFTFGVIVSIALFLTGIAAWLITRLELD